MREMREEIGTNAAELIVNMTTGSIMIFHCRWPTVYGKASIKAKAKMGSIAVYRAG